MKNRFKKLEKKYEIFSPYMRTENLKEENKIMRNLPSFLTSHLSIFPSEFYIKNNKFSFQLFLYKHTQNIIFSTMFLLMFPRINKTKEKHLLGIMLFLRKRKFTNSL